MVKAIVCWSLPPRKGKCDDDKNHCLRFDIPRPRQKALEHEAGCKTPRIYWHHQPLNNSLPAITILLRHTLVHKTLPTPRREIRQRSGLLVEHWRFLRPGVFTDSWWTHCPLEKHHHFWGKWMWKAVSMDGSGTEEGYINPWLAARWTWNLRYLVGSISQTFLACGTTRRLFCLWITALLMDNDPNYFQARLMP